MTSSARVVAELLTEERRTRTRTQDRSRRARLLARIRREAAHRLVAKADTTPGSPEQIAALERCVEALRALLFHVSTERQLEELQEEFPQLRQLSIFEITRSPSE